MNACKEPLIVIGAGGHARSVLDVLQEQGAYEVVGLIDSVHKPGTKVDDTTVLGSEAELPDILRHAGSCVVSDIPGEMVAYGVPCRVVRSRGRDEPYL